MNQPVLFLAFANDQDDYLEALKKESQSINQALESLEDRGLLRIHREESANTNTILHTINRFDGQIAIFHYGGHAGGAGLRLEDTDGKAEGLAQLLARQPNLQLVFLNGCSTQAQTSRLLELGVKAVIATTTSIEDTKATEFAQNFYRKLANKGTVQQAFDFAADSLAFTYDASQRPQLAAVETKRGIVLSGDQDSEMPWGLYYQQQSPEVLNWTLPTQAHTTIHRPTDGQAYEANEYIYSVLGAMADHNESLAKQIDTLEDEREFLDLIIKNFPWNIGSQISILVSTDERMATPRLSRLEQIVSTYIACGQFLLFSLLSQSWEKRDQGEIDRIPLTLEDGFGLYPDNAHSFDHIAQFRRLLETLNLPREDLFMPEMYDFYQELITKRDLSEAHLYLESIKTQLGAGASQNLETEIVAVCADAEYALSIILSQLAFLVNYVMVTVRDIYLFNPRHRAAEYKHQIGKVSAHTDDRVMMFRDLKAMQNSLDSGAIVLLRDLDQPDERLNLTPFFIDKNAYGNKTASATDLYTFAFRKKAASGQEEYYYLKSSHNFFRALEEELDQLHTGIEVAKETGRRELKARLRIRKQPEKVRPYAMLKEQFDHLKTFLTPLS